MAGVRTGPQRRQGSRWINRVAGSATLAAAILVPPVAFPTYPIPSSTGLAGGGVLTPDAGDSYTYSSSTGAMDAAALPSNTSGNLRAVFWPTHGLATQDEQSCATWAAESTWQAQQGAALRVKVQYDGAVRAVTVTKNVWFGATWIFNVHVWNSRWQRAFRQIGWFDLESTFREPSGFGAELPWRLCARVRGTKFDFKVWRLSTPAPQWGDTAHGGSVTLPTTAPVAGFAGWYIGHLPAGATASFTRLGTSAWPDPGAPPVAVPSPALVFGSTNSSGPSAGVVIRGPGSPR